MTIKEAKEQIKNAMRAYFSKDETGSYEIPVERQRPVFLMGPPGIGKTAVMEQVAQEMDVALLSYSMTHHTRQSALGLPYISHKTYDGVDYEISEYTMSEIIASVYDLMEASGKREGILFLDEINCVSETLAPVMLQFLQYKVFGRHRVPNGWIVVTAGNPPEYNSSVREFDIVTWDRLKRIDIEPDFDCWKEYAIEHGIHASVLTYLEIKKQNFYRVETSVAGKTFVTARGWDDLGQMIRLYEKKEIPVDSRLIGQYLQNTQIARDFAAYYALFNKYRSDYQVDTILAGNASAQIRRRAENARFDERLSILGLVLDALFSEAEGVMRLDALAGSYMAVLKEWKAALPSAESMESLVKQQINRQETMLHQGKVAGSLSAKAQKQQRLFLSRLQDLLPALEGIGKPEDGFSAAKADCSNLLKELKEKAAAAKERLNNVFLFCEETFGAEGQEMLILVTELTVHPDAAGFIGRYGCEQYFAHNKELLLYERQQEILQEMEL